VAFSEIEPFPCAVLAHHYPNVPNWGDMSKFQEWPDAAIDVLVGGTPCQAFSVAGLRKGLADPRGNLTLTYLAIAARYRPQWVVWENVPGVLSDRTGAFGSLLGGLAELGYGWAYRVLDAQYFGLAQRRRRVFVVGSLGGWASAAAVLFESESLRGNPAPRRGSGEGTAVRAKDGPGDRRWLALTAPTLNAAFGKKQGLEDQHALGGAGLFVPDYINALTAHNGARNEVSDILNGCVVTAHAFDARQSGVIQYGDMTGPLDTDGHSVAVPMRESGQGYWMEDDIAGTLRAEGEDRPSRPSHVIGIPPAMQVRRLTPRECERLQGFPDDYTLIPHRGKPAADGPRYKALGNSMAVPCMRWIGQRIAMVEHLEKEAKNG
jgi:DNA (cytosine-5)-methyltransferase 1